MDIQRSLLIGAAVLLSFMLLTEWVAFKDERTAPATAEARLTAQNDRSPVASEDTANLLPATPADPVAEVPAAQVPLGAGDEDLPALPATAAGAVATASDSDESSVPAAEIVSIYTDTLRIAVDLRGGDIVEAALPRFLERLDDPDTPFILLESGTSRTYVAQSGLIGRDGIDSKGRALFSADSRRFELGDADTLQVDLRWTSDNGVEVTKRFTLERGSYLVDVRYLVTNNSDTRWQANLFGQIKRDSSPPPQSGGPGMGVQPFLGAATTAEEDRFLKFDFEDMRDEPYRAQMQGGWIAMLQHYFLSAWIPDPDQTNTYSTRVTRDGFNIAGFVSPGFAVDPGASTEVSARFYVGPKDQYSLKEISPFLELSVDYGWLWWIAQPLFWLLTKIQGFVGNWGVAIILLTVLIKGVFFQLSATSYKSMAKMRQVQPKMTAIREEYADDKQKQSQAMMELYRKEKINPMGGCLPILVQMPVFIALYWVLLESVELRHAPFALWIDDLSVMDPYYILPLLMGASMFFMQKLNPPPPDPMQAKIMQWLPVIFTFFFLWFPAGLV